MPTRWDQSNFNMYKWVGQNFKILEHKISVLFLSSSKEKDPNNIKDINDYPDPKKIHFSMQYNKSKSNR